MNLHCESLRTTSTYSHQNAHLFAHTCTYCSFEQYTLYMDVRSKARENAYKSTFNSFNSSYLCLCLGFFVCPVGCWGQGINSGSWSIINSVLIY